MEQVTRNDPYSNTGSGPTDWRSFVPLAAIACGLLLVFAGVVLALNAFMVVRQLLVEPDVLVPYLDSWAAVVGDNTQPTPDAEPAADIATENSAETAPVSDVAVAAVQAEVVSDSPTPPVSYEAFNFEEPEDTLDALIQFIQQSGLARTIGAIFILFLVSMLIRLPWLLVKSGTEILLAVREK